MSLRIYVEYLPLSLSGALLEPFDIAHGEKNTARVIRLSHII